MACVLWFTEPGQLKHMDPDRGWHERKNGVPVHAGCWLHRIVMSKAPPPTTLTPVAEKNVNSCMSGGQHCMSGQRGGEDRSSSQMQSSCRQFIGILRGTIKKLA